MHLLVKNHLRRLWSTNVGDLLAVCRLFASGKQAPEKRKVFQQQNKGSAKLSSFFDAGVPPPVTPDEQCRAINNREDFWIEKYKRGEHFQLTRHNQVSLANIKRMFRKQLTMCRKT